MTHWESRDSDDVSSSSANVEMTSYVLLATLHGLDQSEASSVLPIVRWLTTQRNSHGGFSSTQVQMETRSYAQVQAHHWRRPQPVRHLTTGIGLYTVARQSIE